MPGNRSERFLKARNSGADAVVLDLEDSVPPAEKTLARENIAQALPALQAGGFPCLIRLNNPKTAAGQEDLSFWTTQTIKPDGWLIAKCETAETLDNVATSCPNIPLFPLIESAVGLAALPEITKVPGVCRLAFGHLDFIADTGMILSDDQRELDFARFQINLQSRLAGLAPAIDGITPSLEDQTLIHQDTLRALQFGFGGKLCVHPGQISSVHEAFMPSLAEIRKAERIINAAKEAKGGVIRLEGRMIDPPVLKAAEQVLLRAGCGQKIR